MTETQKEIIEIIEPFMDKTLTVGCLVELKRVFIRNLKIKDWFIIKDGPFEIITDGFLDYFRYTDTYLSDTPKKNRLCYGTDIKTILKYYVGDTDETRHVDVINKIFGHYDITSVLKYIERKIPGGYSGIRIHQDKIEFIGIGNIKNKPLHLYTEEENKNLLELLKNLGTQK